MATVLALVFAHTSAVCYYLFTEGINLLVKGLKFLMGATRSIPLLFWFGVFSSSSLPLPLAR